MTGRIEDRGRCLRVRRDLSQLSKLAAFAHLRYNAEEARLRLNVHLFYMTIREDFSNGSFKFVARRQCLAIVWYEKNSYMLCRWTCRMKGSVLRV